jgi:hypothetical protein
VVVDYPSVVTQPFTRKSAPRGVLLPRCRLHRIPFKPLPAHILVPFLRSPASSRRFRRWFAVSSFARGSPHRSFSISPLWVKLRPPSSHRYRRSAHRYKRSFFGFLRSRANLRRTRATSQRARATCARTRATCIRTPASCERTRAKCPRLWANCPRPFGFCPRAFDFCARQARAASRLDATTGPRRAGGTTTAAHAPPNGNPSPRKRHRRNFRQKNGGQKNEEVRREGNANYR